MSKCRHLFSTSYCRYYSVQQAKKKLPIISCKRPEFNHFEGQSYSKFEGIKLVSHSWLSSKSKNDYFVIHGAANKKEQKNVHCKSFEEIGVNSQLLEVIAEQGITLPTAIQAKAIPSILNGTNTVVTAETGCGKTLAYLLPLFQHIMQWKPSVQEEFNSPMAVVITPCRELASQIGEVAQNIGQSLNINVSTLIGGQTKRKMMNPPIEYVDMLVTTLGAYSKLVTTGIYKVNNVHHIVLDEADTLLDDSFVGKLSHLLKKFSVTSQIGEVAQNIGQSLNINVSTLIGGQTKRKMMNPPIEYVDMLVTTLGAYSKLVTTGIYKVNNVHHIVLDEADTLLDDSFVGKLSHLLKKFSIQYKTEIQVPPVGCQVTLVSATMPHELPESVSSFVAPESLKTVTTANIHRVLPHVPQKFLRLGKAQKPMELLKLVQADVNLRRPVMIFSNKTSTCDFVSMYLNENNINCININGQMNVALKTGKFEAYKNGKVGVLSCTDIASRGLDTIRTQHIINYDFPLYTADYIHRCGRTGRLGAPEPCHVTNFVAWPREIALVQKIEESVRKHNNLPSVNANIRRIIENRIAKIQVRNSG